MLEMRKRMDTAEGRVHRHGSDLLVHDMEIELHSRSSISRACAARRAAVTLGEQQRRFLPFCGQADRLRLCARVRADGR